MSKNRHDLEAMSAEPALTGSPAASPPKKTPAKRTLLQSMAAIERIMNRLPPGQAPAVLVWLNSQYKEPCLTSSEAVKEAMSRG